MKVTVHPKGFILSGKAWEIKAKLREYRDEFEYVQDWIKAADQTKQ
jgi:hypothetical protein